MAIVNPGTSTKVAAARPSRPKSAGPKVVNGRTVDGSGPGPRGTPERMAAAREHRFARKAMALPAARQATRAARQARMDQAEAARRVKVARKRRLERTGRVGESTEVRNLTAQVFKDARKAGARGKISFRDAARLAPGE